MRVLFNLLDAGVGGGQRVALTIAEELIRRGHAVGVVVPESGPATAGFAELGAATHTASLVSFRRPGIVAGAKLARNYDLVYSHSSAPGEILGGIVAAIARKPHAVHKHTPPYFSARPGVRAGQRTLYRAVVPRARVVAVAEHIAGATVEAGVPRERIEVIPNGVVVPPAPATPRADTGPVRIGLLGRLDPTKGADVFVEAAKQIGADAELVIGAPSSDGPYGEALLADARAANVAFVVPAGPEFLRDLDVVAVPSRFEGHPIVLLEAMALGKPVVASAIPGIREVIEPHDAGVLVAAEDADQLASALRSLAADPERRAALGARAREVATSRYALADVLDRTIRFLERAASERD